MSLIVQKYGGTSVGNPTRIMNVAKRLLATQREGNSVVAVVSAMSGITDSLIKLAQEVASQPCEREMDVLLSTGEHASMALTAMAIQCMGGKAVSLTGAQAGIITNGMHTKSRISNIFPKQIKKHLKEGAIVIVAGFQGESTNGEITTLGRGGSDLSAIALASALNADTCEIFTDVDGVYTCDPNIVPTAKKIQEISYDEMLEMASSGSKVMQSRAVEVAKKFSVAFDIRSSFNYNQGTSVKEESAGMEEVVVRGISVERKQAKITVTHVPNKPGSAARIFSALAKEQIMVDVIVQNLSLNGTTDLSFTINRDDLEKAGYLLDHVVKEMMAGTLIKQDGIAKLSLVGIGMRTHSGVAAKLFEALAQGGINIQMISTSEIKIAVILDEQNIEDAANLAHRVFGLDAL